MHYTFNGSIAKEIGVDEAVMLENLHYWVSKNQANNKHFHEDTYWTYNSIHAFEALFPFWSKRQITRILNNLKDKNFIITGNFNKVAYDRTKWYALTEKAYSILQNSDMEYTKKLNGILQNGEIEDTQTVEPIPNNKPNNKPNNYIYNIFQFWNMQKIICHKELTKDIDKAIDKALKIYTEDEIIQAIDVYKEILDSDFYFDYKWNLKDFLNRKNGISTFMNEGSIKETYKEWRKKLNGANRNGGIGQDLGKKRFDIKIESNELSAEERERAERELI